MQKVFAYIGLHMKLRLGEDGKADNKGQLTTLIIGLLTITVMLFLLKYFLDVIIGQFAGSVKKEDISMLLFTVIEFFLTISCVSMQIKYLLKPFDITITARFPMTSFQMFLAEMTMIYVYLQVFSAVILFPVMLIFGWSAGFISGAYIGYLLLTILFAPIIPFVIATFLAIPTLFVLSVLENHNIIKLIIFILALAGIFVLYNYVLNILADYYIHQRIDNNTMEIWNKFIAGLNSIFNPIIVLKWILFDENIGKSILILSLVLFGGIAGGFSLAKLVYDRVHTRTLEGARGIFQKKSSMTSENAFFAIIKKELKDIVRTHTYAYFYLGIAITTPVMVFLCDRLVKKVGEAQLGSSVSFGVSTLVLLIFMGMINSFSASAISREDKTFYITKIVPVRFKTQLLAKGTLNFAVSMGALIISSIIIATLKFVSPLQIAVIFITSGLSAVGMIANGFNINLKHPNIGSKANGDINEINITRMLFTGLLFSGLVGFMAFVLSYVIEIKYVYMIIALSALVYMVINLLIFFMTAERKYYAIEYK